MELINNININIEPQRNIKELLDGNTNSYKVVPSIGAKTSIPVYSVDNDVRTIAKKTGKSSSSFIVNTTINCVGTSYEKANDMLQEARSLLQIASKCPSLSVYNMNFQDEIIGNQIFSRGGKSYKVRTLTLQFVVQ